MTKQEIRDFFAGPVHPRHRRYEAMRAFFHERLTAREVAERFGYTVSAVYNMTRAFARLDDPATAYFRDPPPRGRPLVRPEGRLRERIVELRKHNYSILDIKACLDAEEPCAPSERVILNVLRDEGFPRLPRRTRGERSAIAPPRLQAPVSGLLAPGHRESFQCEAAAGVLCLLPFLRRYGIDRAIQQAGFPDSGTLPALPSVLAFVALKLAGVRRYSGDDLWCMDRGLGLFAGLNVLPKTAWLSSYADRVAGPMNQALVTGLARIWSQREPTFASANLDLIAIPRRRADAAPRNPGAATSGRDRRSLAVALAQDPESGLILRTDTGVRHAFADSAVLEFLDFFRRSGSPVRYLAIDGRFTTYQNLARLHRDGVLFITMRRRGKNLVEQACAIPAADRRNIRVPLDRGTRHITAYDARVTLRAYGGELRQITIWPGARHRPALLLTNDFDSPMARILRRYARRWMVENSMAEQLSFFHLNRPSSSMAIKVEFDLAITVVAYNLYRLLALDLPAGYRHLTARALFDQLLATGAAVQLDTDTCTVALKKKRRLPALLQALEQQDPVRIPWLGNRRIIFQADTRS